MNGLETNESAKTNTKSYKIMPAIHSIFKTKTWIQQHPPESRGFFFLNTHFCWINFENSYPDKIKETFASTVHSLAPYNPLGMCTMCGKDMIPRINKKKEVIIQP